jgi:spoIIIJ-associated protein
MKKKLKMIEKETRELLEHLGIETAVEVNEETTGEGQEKGVVHVNLKPSDPGILIGYHGETLFSFQLILSMIIYRKSGSWTQILVDVGDYRQRREEWLKTLALNAAKRVKFSGEAYVMPFLIAAERRLVHLILADHPEVTTQSEGEGRNRRIVVKPK